MNEHLRALADSAPLALRRHRVDVPSLSVEIARGRDVRDVLDTRWDALVLRNSLPNPTLSSIWLGHFLALEQGTPYAVTVSAEQRLVAAGAFAVREPLGRRGLRIARWLGPGRLLNQPDVIVDAAAADVGAERVLMTALLDNVHAVYLGKIGLEGPAARALRALTPWLHERRSDDGWVLPLPPPSLSHASRKAAYERRHAARLGAAISIAVRRLPDELRPALERLFLIYIDRWRGRVDEIDRFATRREQRAWYRRVLGDAAEADSVRIVEVFEDGVLVASLLGLLAGRGALFHTTAMRPGGRLEGPGHHALLAWIEEARRSGAAIMDLGRGSADPGSPKSRLRPSPVPFGRIVAASSKRLQRAIVAACNAAVVLRDAPRSVRTSRHKATR